jgi:hypothetical protein
MKIKLIDKKGWQKVINVSKKVSRVKVPIIGGEELEFELFDISKKGLQIFKEVEQIKY